MNTSVKDPPPGLLSIFYPRFTKMNKHPAEPSQVATYSSVTYLLDKYITEITGHLLPLIPGSLIDTQDFLRKLPDNPVSSGSTLLTADVTSLYPNIPWDEGIIAATDINITNINIHTQPRPIPPFIRLTP
jgi:hypothetical protein